MDGKAGLRKNYWWEDGWVAGWRVPSIKSRAPVDSKRECQINRLLKLFKIKFRLVQIREGKGILPAFEEVGPPRLS